MSTLLEQLEQLAALSAAATAGLTEKHKAEASGPYGDQDVFAEKDADTIDGSLDDEEQEEAKWQHLATFYHRPTARLFTAARNLLTPPNLALLRAALATPKNPAA